MQFLSLYSSSQVCGLVPPRRDQEVLLTAHEAVNFAPEAWSCTPLNWILKHQDLCYIAELNSLQRYLIRSNQYLSVQNKKVIESPVMYLKISFTCVKILSSTQNKISLVGCLFLLLHFFDGNVGISSFPKFS
jgi:hypothetical protein